MPTPFVSILIVNYNGKRYLDDCLGAVEGQNYPRDRWEVVLVDNGSADGSVEYLRAHYPWVRVIAAGRNLGFAGGNNEGYRHCRGELIALLNNDTVAEPRWLAALVEAVSEDPRIGAATSKILFKHEPGTINSAGLNLYRDGRGGDRGFRQPDLGQYDEPVDVFGACGASVLLRREMLEDVGFFDERLFMYGEDLDLAWRAHFRGWRFRYTPASVVYHVHCGSSGEGSAFFLYHVERNRVLVNLKNAPPRQALYTFAVFAAKAARQWWWLLTLREPGRSGVRKGLAYGLAGLSLLTRIPGMMWQRFQIRGRRRLVEDREFQHLILPKPTPTWKSRLAG